MEQPTQPATGGYVGPHSRHATPRGYRGPAGVVGRVDLIDSVLMWLGVGIIVLLGMVALVGLFVLLGL